MPTFTQLGVDRLRFFLRGRQSRAAALRTAVRPYDLGGLCRRPERSGAGDRAGRRDRAGRVRPEEALLPWPARSFVGFRLLTEYLRLSEKFLFVDFHPDRRPDAVAVRRQPAGDLRLPRPRAAGTRANRSAPTRWRSAARRSSTCSRSAASRSADPHRHRVPHRAGRAATGGDRSLAGRTGARNRADGSSPAWRPVYRLTAADPEQTVLRAASTMSPGAQAAPPLGGSEVYSPRTTPASIRDAAAAACCRSTRCASTAICRRPAVRRRPPGAAAGRSRSAARPSRLPDRPDADRCARPLRERRFWRFVSHLSLGHLSVVGGAEGAAALRVLRLYDLQDSQRGRAARSTR